MNLKKSSPENKKTTALGILVFFYFLLKSCMKTDLGEFFLFVSRQGLTIQFWRTGIEHEGQVGLELTKICLCLPV